MTENWGPCPMKRWGLGCAVKDDLSSHPAEVVELKTQTVWACGLGLPSSDLALGWVNRLCLQPGVLVAYTEAVREVWTGQPVRTLGREESPPAGRPQCVETA